MRIQLARRLYAKLRSQRYYDVTRNTHKPLQYGLGGRQIWRLLHAYQHSDQLEFWHRTLDLTGRMF